MLQYVERQVVLVDALEDAAYSSLHNLSGKGSLSELMMRTERTGNLEELKNQLQEFSIRPVLTAHPRFMDTAITRRRSTHVKALRRV